MWRLCWALVALAFAAAFGPASADAARLAPSPAAQDYGQAPLSFVPNRGQIGGDTRYSAQGAGFGFAFGDGGVALSFPGRPPADGASALDAPELGQAGRGALVELAGSRSIDLDLSFIDADRGAAVSGRRKARGKVNYLLGDDPSRWQRNLPTFSELSYEALWPGIDMRFRGTDGALKYEFELAPGADPAAIGLAYAGARSLSIAPDGALLIETARGTLRDAPPDSHQVIDGRRVAVESRYELRGENGYGFELGPYDRSRPLLIDPGIAYATFLGGSGGSDEAWGIAVDGAGSAYVAGRTSATDFPTTSGAPDTTANGNDDVFVSKLSPDGGSLVYSTYLGSTGQDVAYAIAVDNNGAAYVTGLARDGFPTTTGAFDDSYNGGFNDAFVTKLTPGGSSLAYSTFLGGTQSDEGRGIAVDSAGSAYVTGAATAGFPTTGGAFDTTPTGFNVDAFATKLAPDGGSLAYSTILGAGPSEVGRAIAVDGTGSAYVTGFAETQNPAFGNYPTTEGAFDEEAAVGATDAFATKVAPDGGGLSWSTFLGGTRGEVGTGIDVDDSGSAYVAGTTGGGNPTTEQEFPTTPGAFDTTKGSASNDAFVTKLAADGGSLAYSTLLGGDVPAGGAPDGAAGVVVNDAGEAHVTGYTTTSDFPTTENAYRRTPGLSFVTQLSSDGGSLVYSTYFPAGVGQATEAAKAIDIDSAGDIYIAGADNGGMPTTPGAFDRSAGGVEAFVAKLETPRTLTVVRGESAGGGTGTVTSEPAGIDCGADCEQDFDPGTPVTLTATPDDGSEFSHWVGACTDVSGNVCELTMDEDRTERAVFEAAAPTADLSITKADSPDPVAVGEEFDYTLAVENLGPDGADRVRVRDTIPDTLELVSYPDSCTIGEGTLECAFGDLDDGGRGDVTFTVRAAEAGTVTNTARVLSDTADPVADNDSDSQTTTVLAPQRTLTVTRDGNGSGNVSSEPPGIDCGADCTEDYDNGTEVTLTATPDPGSEFAGWSGAPCNEPSEPAVCTFNIDTDDQVTATFELETGADLAIEKTDSQDPVAVNEEFDYTLAVDNLGPSGADGVSVEDDLPSSLQIVDLPEECTFTESGFSCFLGEMGNGGRRELTITVRGTEAGTVNNTATVSSNTDDPDPANDSDTETTAITGDRTLTVTKGGFGSGTVTSDPAGIDCGDDCTEAYEDGTVVTLTAEAAPGSRFDGWGGACADSEGDTCDVTMDASQSVSATFTVLSPGTDLAITKDDSTVAGSVQVGEIFDYRLLVENLGATADDEVTVLDELPDSLDVIYIPPECGLDENNVLDCDLGRLAGGESRLLTITVRPTSIGTLENTATVSGAEDDPVFMNNMGGTSTFVDDANSRPRTLRITKDGAGSGTVTSEPPNIDCGDDCAGTYPEGSSVTVTATPTSGSAFAGWAGDCAGATGSTCTVNMNVDRAARATFVPARADLVIAKSDSVDPVEVGEPFDYTLAVQNSGPDPAENVLVTDAIPFQLEVVDVPEECELAESTLQCELGDLPDGDSRDLTIRVRATQPGAVENTANVSSSITDPVPGNDSDSETTTVTAPPAGSRTLTVTKDGTGSGTVSSFPGGIDCGDDCSQSYADGTTVTLTADPAEGSAFAGWAGDCAGSPGTTCELVMDAGRSAQATFNDAPPADLTIDKSDSADPVIVGDEFDYDLEVGNLGPNTARDVTVGDALPAGVEFVDAPADCTREDDPDTPQDENLVICDLGDIPPNEALEVAIRVRATEVGTLENTAEVAAAASSDPEAANDTDTETTTVRPEQRTLSVTKGGDGEGTVTSAPAGIDCGADCAETYDEATAVTLTADPAPGSFFARWEPDCEGAERNTCDVVLDEDTSVQAIFEPAQPGADLEITKSDSQDPVEVRERFRYTLRVENYGADTAQGVEVVDDLAAGLSVVGVPTECGSVSGGGASSTRVRCFLGTMAAGATRSLVVAVEPTQAGTFESTATVSTTSPDPVSTNDTDSETTTVVKGNERAIARWPLNVRDFDSGGPFTPDVSGNGLIGRDAQATVVPGRFRNAFSLDGEGDGFTAGDPINNPQLEPPDANGLSVVAWVRSQPAGPAPGANETIVAKGGRGCRAPSYGLMTGENGGLEFSVQVDDDAAPAGTATVVRTPSLDPATVWNSEWHAVTAVYGPTNEDGSHNIALWVDGRRVAGANVPETSHGINYFSQHIVDRQLTVGRTPPDSTQFNPNACTDDRSLNAQLDDVRIYGEALDRREIRFLHNPSAAAPPFLDEDTAPLNTVRPEISGTPTPGTQLSCTQGSWTGNDSGPVNYTTVWERAPRAVKSEDDQSWAPIDGATGPSYTVQDIDVSSRVRCRVTRTDVGGTADGNSRSLRVDLGPPQNVVAPQVVGIPTSDTRFGVVTCEPGQWTNGPEARDFTYQWISAGRVIPGATGKNFRPRQRRVKGGFREVNPDGDGNRFISCQVTARNDVGSRLHNSQAELAVDDVPIFPSAPGAPVIQAPGETGVSSTADVKVGDPVTCSNGRIGGQDVNWVDGYGDKDYYRARGFSLTFEWFRQGAAIPGETGRTYAVRFEDLGRELRCRITNTNPLGSSRTDLSITKRINLPTGERDSMIYQVGGINQADPTNLLALSDDYRRIVQDLTVERLTAGLKRVEQDCRARNDIPAAIFRPENPADIEGVQRQINDRTRCQIILRSPLAVAVRPEGIRYVPPAPAACTTRFAGDFPLCPNLRIQVTPIDPKNPPATDAELARRLAPVTPDRFLWDLDRDGRTDAVCPGTAPVLRTIYNPGDWNPRVVIVDRGSEKLHFTDYFFRAPGNKTVANVVRNNQVRVCATAFDPPPNPEKTPCITHGQVGRVQLEGDLCPIDVREINPLDFDNFDGQIYEMLRAQSEERLRSEGVETSSARRDPESTEPIWLDMGEPKPPRGGLAARITAGIAQRPPGTGEVSATYVNTAASLSGIGPGTTLPDVSNTLKQKLGAIPSFQVPKAGFAMNQVYISRGDVMKLNGTSIDPLGDSAALVVPSDVKNALGSVQELNINARNAATFLGSKAGGIPLAEGGALKQQLSDRAGQAGKDLLRQTNLDELVQKLKGAADKLDLGPFKLRGTAEVKIEDDGTASLTAKAVLPGLKLGVGKSTEASAQVTLRADRSGNVKLEGLRIRPPGIAYLGGVALKDLDLAYDGGLDVRGKILFPPPIAAGININRFKLGPKGEFQILDVDFTASPGIKVGPGVFITKLGGKLNLLDDIVGGNTTLSVGPGTGGGCPTIGINAEFNVHFAELFYLDATGTVQLVCLDLVKIKFRADQTGLVSLEGGVDYSVGPLFFKVNMGGAIRLPNWQVTYNGSGGVRNIPLIGTVSAGFQIALSNVGLAGCATIKLPIVPDLSGGAAVRFPGGVPPLNPVSLVANLRFFLGCDISEYRSVVQTSIARGAQAGGTAFTVPRGTGKSVLSFEGAGGAPLVRLRSPSGKVLDFTDAAGPDGKTVRPAHAIVIEQEDRTVVFTGRTEAGTWTAETADGSPEIVRVRVADIMPKPEVTGRVTGKGTRRVLRYRVKPLDGQRVRILEKARGGQKVLRTVQRGGSGRIPFRVTEASSRRRRIVAEVIQDGMPRDNLTVTRFSAPRPRVGKPRRVQVRRRGSKAVVTWQRASFSRGHEVVVHTGTGRRYVVRRQRQTRRLVIPRIRRKEGVVVRVAAFSPSGRRGRYARARLRGTMRVGSVRKARIRHPNVVRRERARERRADRRGARERSRARGASTTR